jgi:hypothetical protein
MMLFGPHSIIKIRSAATDSMAQMLGCLKVLFQGRYSIREEVESREWALIGAIGDDSEIGEIPIRYRADMPQVSQSWLAPPRSRPYGPLSGAAKYPAGATPSKCIIIIIIIITSESVRIRSDAYENT